MVWETIGPPGPTIDKVAQIEEWNSLYGEGNWRKIHVINGVAIPKPGIFLYCEKSYRKHAEDNLSLWQKLFDTASEVFDKQVEEIQEGTDYSLQTAYTHFHDICIRIVGKENGLEFKGDEPIQIRYADPQANEFFSSIFDPYKLPFHDSSLIPEPQLEGKWDDGSVEQFYQELKVLQVRRNK